MRGPPREWRLPRRLGGIGANAGCRLVGACWRDIMTTRDRSSTPRPRGFLALARRLALILPAGLALASCGGGAYVSVGDEGSGLSCSVGDQQTFLAEYFASDYL